MFEIVMKLFVFICIPIFHRFYRQDGVSNAHVRVLVRNNGRRANDVTLVAHAP